MKIHLEPFEIKNHRDQCEYILTHIIYRYNISQSSIRAKQGAECSSMANKPILATLNTCFACEVRLSMTGLNIKSQILCLPKWLMIVHVWNRISESRNIYSLKAIHINIHTQHPHMIYIEFLCVCVLSVFHSNASLKWIFPGISVSEIDLRIRFLPSFFVMCVCVFTLCENAILCADPVCIWIIPLTSIFIGQKKRVEKESHINYI